EEGARVGGGGVDEGAVALQDRRGIVEGVGQRAAHDVTDLVEPELEAGDDPEVAAAAAQCPEQILVLIVAGRDLPAIGENDIGREQVVDREPHAAGEVADAATQREARYPGRGDDSAGRGEAERVGRVVYIPPGRAAPNPGDLLGRVDPYALHGREVDDQPVVHCAESGNAVAAATDGQVAAALAGSGDHGHHVGRIRALD